MMKSSKHWEVCILLVAATACDRRAAEAATAAGELQTVRVGQQKPSLDFVKIEPVTEATTSSAVSLTGRVAFDEDHTQRLASPIDGRVTSLLVESGDQVAAGQRLIELSSPEVARLQSEAQKARQDLAVAQKSIERVRRMRADGAVSDKDLVQAEADYKKAFSDVARNQAELKALGISAADPTVRGTLRAQISGTVVTRSVLVGQEVRADGADPLITITNLDRVWVLADAYEQDLDLVENGATVKLHATAYPDEVFTGIVGHVGDVLDPATRTVKVRCIFANSNHRLKPEMFVNVEVESRSDKKVIMIPSRAIVRSGEATKAIVALAGNVFRERVIDVGPERAGKVRLLAGLTPGERIVTDGALFLQTELRD